MIQFHLSNLNGTPHTNAVPLDQPHVQRHTLQPQQGLTPQDRTNIPQEVIHPSREHTIPIQQLTYRHAIVPTR